MTAPAKITAARALSRQDCDDTLFFAALDETENAMAVAHEAIRLARIAYRSGRECATSELLSSLKRAVSSARDADIAAMSTTGGVS